VISEGDEGEEGEKGENFSPRKKCEKGERGKKGDITSHVGQGEGAVRLEQLGIGLHLRGGMMLSYN
jgi:hypothetical protein